MLLDICGGIALLVLVLAFLRLVFAPLVAMAFQALFRWGYRRRARRALRRALRGPRAVPTVRS